MKAPASLLGFWYALGPADRPFSAGDPAWVLHRIVEDDPASPMVVVENAGGQRFSLGRTFARSIAFHHPSSKERLMASQAEDA